MNKENKYELTIETKHVVLNNNDSQTLVQVLNLSKNIIENLKMWLII